MCVRIGCVGTNTKLIVIMSVIIKTTEKINFFAICKLASSIFLRWKKKKA